MPKRRGNLNTIYISERLQECLRQIEFCTLTTVIAPMGYGKTTAVNWFLTEKAHKEKINIVRISVYSDNIAIFWKSIQDAFNYAGFCFLQEYPYPNDPASGSLLVDAVCHELSDDTPCYIFLDDFHLMTERRVTEFICLLVGRLPENVHLIIASRDRFLPSGEILRLGNKVHQISIGNLRLNHTELSVYAHKCGTELSATQIDKLLYSSEGWFSAIYLNLRTFSEQGILADNNSDIYTMFSAAMIEPLKDDQREFLAVMGLADEFTVEMASYITGYDSAESMIKTMTEQNAFVTRLPDNIHFRFHHMMKECAERSFKTLPIEKQLAYRNRYGDWYKDHEQYIHALAAYRQSENYDSILDVVQADAGILLATQNPDEVISLLDKCPVEILSRHPFSLLVLMRSMFNWHRIPKMLEIKALLVSAIKNHPELQDSEKGNLLGECDLITSFLMYNDISAMSKLHRSASEKMTHEAISLSNKGGWTFGSPSVFMMYYREPGELAKYLVEMDECMPHYYKITDGHGKGAEKIMRAEACLMQGDFVDARLLLEQAYNMAESANQENMILCADFVAQRLSLFTEIKPRCTFEERYKELLSQRNIAQINILNANQAYYYSLLGQEDKIPDIFRRHMLSTINLLAPGKPMNEMIENQVYLLQQDYPKVIAKNTELIGMCLGMHYSLVAIHLNIQTAAAYEKMGKRMEAISALKKALDDAMPDSLALPFAESIHYIKDVMKECICDKNSAFIDVIYTLGDLFEKRISKQKNKTQLPDSLSVLTKREYEIATLMHERMSGREIANKLFISEGSVKQYVNQIYSKLQIEGDRRIKRQKLFEIIEKK